MKRSDVFWSRFDNNKPLFTFMELEHFLRRHPECAVRYRDGVIQVMSHQFQMDRHGYFRLADIIVPPVPVSNILQTENHTLLLSDSDLVLCTIDTDQRVIVASKVRLVCACRDYILYTSSDGKTIQVLDMLTLAWCKEVLVDVSVKVLLAVSKWSNVIQIDDNRFINITL